VKCCKKKNSWYYAAYLWTSGSFPPVFTDAVEVKSSGGFCTVIPKILLVDDVKLLLELEKSFLKHSSVRIFTASDGAEALRTVLQERPDLVYMDLNMPVMDGKTCCATIKSDPSICSTPVIMVTTAGSQTDEQKCRDAGCDDYLTKPIDRRVFLAKGRRFVPDIDRREPRVSCLTEIALVGGAALGNASASDISVGGIFVASDRKPETDGELKIAFTLPGSGITIQAKGRVAWQNNGVTRMKPRLPNGFGVEFTEIDTDAIKEIRHYVEEQKNR
jgi:CheY-like chemotaxis protein